MNEADSIRLMDLFTQIGRLQIPTCKIAGGNLLEGGSGLQTGSPFDMVFDMVLSSNSRSAENPDTKGQTRFAFFEVGVLGSLRAIHWD